MKLTLTWWVGLSNQEVLHSVSNKESSSERRNYVQQEQKDLLYADAKNLIQSRRMWIRVASLSLAFFATRRFWVEADLYPTSIYTILLSARYIISYLSSL